MEELESQLRQMKEALNVAHEDDRPGLETIIRELEDLITFSSRSTGDSNAGQLQISDASLKSANSEFIKFKSEIAQLEGEASTSGTKVTTDSDIRNDVPKNIVNDQLYCRSIENDLAALEGMKCSAPFQHHWGQIGYYNAVVLGVETTSDPSNEESFSSMDSIFVRLVFSQPIVESMLPCPYYKEGRCRFLDAECKFSHGEVISLSQLREYKEPDFTKILPNTRVLAKYTDGLWYQATVLKITDSGECELRYDADKKVSVIPLHETTPLDEKYDTTGNSGSSISSEGIDSSEDSEEDMTEIITSVNIGFPNIETGGSLGEWEKHTKGIGSKLMTKMGYVKGTGLGRYGDGRVEPVDAVVLPPGLSLDRCMELKERAGKAVKLCGVENTTRRTKKRSKITKVAFKKVKKSVPIFEFINSKLQKVETNSDIKLPGTKALELNKESCSDLNKKFLGVGTSIKQVTKDISKLKEGMRRHEGRDQTTVQKMKMKIESMEQYLIDLKRSENGIISEKRHRHEVKKLTIF